MPNTINIGTTQALEFKLVGDHSSSTLSFSLYESSGGSALFTKSGASITKVYNAPYTFIQVAILKGDTSGLTGGYKDYTISGTSGVLESGSIYCSPVTHNATDPLSQFDRLTTRIIALEASEFDNGDFLRVVETDGVKSFVNLTPAEVRTALEVAKIDGGSATELYLKWNNTTSKWETRTLVEIQGDLGIDGIIEDGTSTKLYAKWDNAQGKWIARTLAEMQGDLGIASVFTLLGQAPITVGAGQQVKIGEYTNSTDFVGLAYVCINSIIGSGIVAITFYADGVSVGAKTYTGGNSYSADNVLVFDGNVFFDNSLGEGAVTCTYKVHNGIIPA